MNRLGLSMPASLLFLKVDGEGGLGNASDLIGKLGGFLKG